MITTDADVKLERLVSDTLGIFTIRPEKAVNWIPGMFLQLSLSRKTASEPWLDSKPFSIASWGGNELKIIVRREGKFTTSLFEKGSEGFIGTVKYPLGNFYLNGKMSKFFIAGGAGISVFTSFLDFMIKNGLEEKLYLMHSVKRSSESVSSFYWFKLPENVTLISNIPRGDHPEGKLPRLTAEDLKGRFNDTNNLQYYLCGPPDFIDYWRSILVENGSTVKMESWLVS